MKIKHFALAMLVALASNLSASAENYILYTSSDGKVVTPYDSRYFGANIVSNTYEGGQGKILFDGDVTEIGGYSFHTCESLTSIEIPNSVTSIGIHAFDGCSNLASVEIPNSVSTIGNRAFSQCRAMKSVKIGNSVTKIGEYSFASTAISTIDLPNSLKSIGGEAFNGCKDLKSVFIPNSVTTIGAGAFSCTGLQSVEIPVSVTSIGKNAFESCYKLKEVHIPSIEFWCKIEIGEDPFNPFYDLSPRLYVDGKEVKELVVPGSIKKIKPYTFASFCFDKVVLEEGVEEIGKNAFFCYELSKELHLPSTLNKVEELNFNMRVEELYLPNIAMLFKESMQNLPFVFKRENSNYSSGKVFVNGEILSDLVIPESIKEFPYLGKISTCFRSINTGGLTTLPEALNFEAINVYDYYNKFANDYSASILELSNNLKNINATLPKAQLVICHTATPPTITEQTFPLCSFNNNNPGVIILDTPEMENTYLEAPVWKDLMTSNMTNNVEVTVETPGKLATELIYAGMAPAKAVKLKVNGTLNKSDFDNIRTNMMALIDLDLSDLNLDEIPLGALQGKFQLGSLKLPSVCTKLGRNSMNGCTGLKEITLPATLETISSGAFNGCTNLETVFNFSTSNVTTIGDDAFVGTKLKKADFNTGLKTIGKRAFKDVPLRSVSFHYGLTKIGDEAFEGCQLNQELELPEKLQSIGSGAFRGQKITGHLSLPETVSTVGSEAFAGTEISTLFLNSSLTKLSAGVFENCENLNTIYVPDNITSIDERAFAGCSSLADLRFSTTLTGIGVAAFQSSGLRTAIIPDGISVINDETFDQCKNLRTASLPSGTQELGENAFRGCEALRNLTVKAVTPPALSASTFLGVNTNLCIISIPTVSFEDYALANYWGRFVQMRNDIEVETDGNGSINFDNGEEEEGNGDEDEGNGDEDNNDNEDENNGDESANAPARKVLAKAQAAAEAENGSTVFIPKGGKIRFYIIPGAGESIISATFDGEDIKSKIVNGVFTTTADKRGAKLVVKFTCTNAINYVTGTPNHSGKTYNLQGQSVGDSYNGIVIHDGKKYLKK